MSADQVNRTITKLIRLHDALIHRLAGNDCELALYELHNPVQFVIVICNHP